MDPSGDYSVGDVTVEINGVQILKGEKATGAFVRIAPDQSYSTEKTGADGEVTQSRHKVKMRPVTLTLLRSSAGNAKLFSARMEGKVNLAIRRTNGEPLFDGDAFVEEREPRERGDEREWSLSASFG
jgi:hypothetical protein